MNITKVRNSAAIVNYVKPGMEMVEMETEGSLLLTASDNPTPSKATVSVGTNAGTFTGGSKQTASRRN